MSINIVAYTDTLHAAFDKVNTNFSNHDVPSGTAFPTPDAIGQEFYRTDLGMLFACKQVTPSAVWISGDLIVSPTQPTGDAVFSGSTWYDPGKKQFHVYDGTQWNSVSSNIVVGPTAPDPSILVDGILWFDTVHKQLQVYYSNAWNFISGNAIVSDTQPTSSLCYDGLVWYEPTNDVMHMYLNGLFRTIGSSSTFQTYRNTVTLGSNSSTVSIGIGLYDHSRDFLLVHDNSTFLQEGQDYTVSPDSSTINAVSGTWNTGTVFNFVVLYSQPSKDTLNTTSYTNLVSISVDGTTNIPIGITEYNSNTDLLHVYQDNLRLYNGSQWTLNANGTSIDLVGYSLKNGDQLLFEVIKKVRVNLDPASVSGGLIVDGTVTNAKLGPDNKVGSLASLATSTKSDVVSAVNENVAHIGTVGNLATNVKSDTVSAINENNTKTLSRMYSLGNLLHPSRQSFSRGSDAYRKNMDQVPYNVLRTEQGKFGQGAFIEESTTNLAYNSGFETVTGTSIVFKDALTEGTTASPAWTTQSGSFTWSTSGATSGANGSTITAGNSVWKPLTGSNGTALALTVQATFTMPATVPTGYAFLLDLRIDNANVYRVTSNGSTLILAKYTPGYYSLAQVAQTISASTTYTATLSITPSGGLTAKLYSGVGTGGTLLQTLTATDTSLTGGFLIGVGGDTGVIVSNTQVTAPFADNWVIGVDNDSNIRAPYSLTASSLNGSYAVIIPSNISGTGSFITLDGINVSASTIYTVSVWVNIQSISNSGVGIRIIEFNGSNGVLNDTGVQSSLTSVTNGFSRVTYTWTTNAATTHVSVRPEVSGIATAIFDAVQLEQKAYATSYIRNDSTSTSATRQADSLSYNLSNPLPNRHFGVLWWTPAYSSTSPAYSDKTVYYTLNTARTSLRHLLHYKNDTGRFRWSTTNSTPVDIIQSFNAGDRVFLAFLHDPTNSIIQLWVGVNGGALQTASASCSDSFTDASSVYIGCRDAVAQECNGTIDFPIITDIIPTSDQVNDLYKSSEWGGLRDYPGSLPSEIVLGNGKVSMGVGNGPFTIDPGSLDTILSGRNVHLASNAYYANSQWYQRDTTKPSSLLLGQVIGVGSNPIPQFLTKSAMNTPNGAMSWDSSYNLLMALSGGYKVQSGSSQFPTQTMNANTSYTINVSFPTAYTSSPIVVGSLASGMQTTIFENWEIANITTTGFTIYFVYGATIGGASPLITWIAIGS